MSFEPPAGILDIGNATLRVGKLEVAETTGLNQGLQNVIKNDLLVTENTTYTTNQKWGIKLPTTWVAEFEVKGHSGKYIDFNFYNENSVSNAQGYNLTFMDTTMTLKYDNGSALGGGAVTIPTIVGTYRKVHIFFERNVIAVSIDGTRYLYDKRPSVLSRVISATGSAFVNLFIEADAANSAFKNLRIVNGRFISDETSNIAFVGGNLGVGVHSPQEALDIRGNMHFNRVSNVSSVSVDSNVVTEYTGPHDRPLRKYPEVVLTADDNLSTSGYKASVSSFITGNDAFRAFDTRPATNSTYWHSQYPYYTHATGTYNPGQSASGAGTPANGTTLPTTELISGHQGEWIKLQMPTRIKLEEVRVFASHRCVSGTNVYQMPKDIAIAGSNDGTNWYLVDSGTLRTGIRELYGMASLPVTTSSYYSYLALIVKTIDNQGANYSAVEIANIEYYGYEEGSGSLDTTLKTVYNVPATTGTQLEVYYDGRDLDNGAVTSVSGLGGTTIGGTAYGDPQISDGAFVFDGTGDAIQTAATSFTGNAIFTASLWVKLDRVTDSTSQNVIFTIGYDGTRTQSGLRVNEGTGKFRFYTYSGTGSLNTDVTAVTNTWYHLNLVHNGSSGYQLYINGEMVGESFTDDLNLASNSTVGLGAAFASSGTINSSTLPFKGSIANFRLYSKALNADQVKELYDYQKDYFLGSKSQVTLYKGHLGVGVTEPSGQLELAGDERIQEYPPGPLGPSTSYEAHIPGHGVFCWDTVNYYPGSPVQTYNGSGMYANDGATTGWYGPYNGHNGYSGGNVYAGTDFAATSSSGLGFNDAYGNRYYGAWTTFKLPYKINLKKIHINQFATSDNANAKCAPEDGVILGSNNGSEWYHVHTFTGLQYGGTAGTSSYSAAGEDVTITCNTDYSQYALVVTRTLHYAFTAMIGELRWFGTPGPTTLDKGSLTLTRSLDVPRVSRYDVDTETPRPEKLVIHYDTTVNSGGQDISGHGHHGRFLPYTTSQRPYYNLGDKSIVLNGSTSYIFQRDLKQADGNFVHSVSYWLKDLRPSGAGAETFLYFGSAAVATQDMQIQYNFNGNGTIYFGTQGSWQTLGNFGDLGGTGKKLLRGEWNHFAYTYNGTNTSTSNMKFYMNGEEMPMGGGGTSALNFTSGETNFYIGRHASSSHPNYFEGEFSNFMMYNTKLEPSEIKKLYRLGRTGRSTVITDTAVGIGIAPEAQLDVRGDLLVRGAPRTPQRPVFYAYNSTAADTTNGFTGHLLFYHTKINVGRCYNTYDRIFYAPVAGYYFFEFQVLAREASGGAGRVETTLYKNHANISGRAMAYTYLTGASDHDNLAFTTQLYLDVGDLVYPVIHACDTNMDVYYGEDLGHFSGFFIG